MSISNRARRTTALLAVAAVAAPLAHANAATQLDPTNLPCAPTCPNPPAADARSVPAEKVVLGDGGFDWEDAGAGAGIGIAAMLAGLAGVFGARRRQNPA